MKEIKINDILYIVENDEFKDFRIEKYCNLKLFNDITEQERLTGLINDIALDLNISYTLFSNQTHGGFIPININNIFIY